ncbi:MAG: family 43 glycosylhydrolase [Bacteroidales bacterium]|nr:family 43 glycosylhydrolase [Bacteroidales bacterium]
MSKYSNIMKRSTLFSFALTAMFIAGGNANSQNPYLPLWEVIPDGEPYVFEDPDLPGKYRVYIYGSHDVIVNNYCGLDQVVWSASVDDLKNWRYDGIIFESKKDRDGKDLNKDGKGDVLFAPDVLETKDKDGKKVYYLYPNNQARGRNSMIAKSNRPDGPFVVCNWNKDNAQVTDGPMNFDPAAFVDDDGRVYGYWGFEHSFAAELDPETMCTVKPGTQIIDGMIADCRHDNTYRFFEASSIRKIKDKYVFVYSRITNEGENGLPSTNYTLAYCYSNNPLGPWTYGGTIIDGRGKEKLADGSYVATATPAGNTHGSICEINGKWYVFYHRQASTFEYQRQAVVAPIELEVVEGESGYVKIKEAEFTSEGFEVNGLDPTKHYQAGIACYFTGPVPARQEYPNIVYSGSHIEVLYAKNYDGKSNPYDAKINLCPMVNNTSGSIIGYKYFNLSKTYNKENLSLVLSYVPDGVDGTIDIYLDRPSEQDGGIKLATLNIDAKDAVSQKVIDKAKSDFEKSPLYGLNQNGAICLAKYKYAKTARINVDKMKNYNGKHSLFFVFNSNTKNQSICQLNEFWFE